MYQGWQPTYCLFYPFEDSQATRTLNTAEEVEDSEMVGVVGVERLRDTVLIAMSVKDCRIGYGPRIGVL